MKRLASCGVAFIALAVCTLFEMTVPSSTPPPASPWGSTWGYSQELVRLTRSP